MRLRNINAFIRVAIFLLSAGIGGVLNVTAGSGESPSVKASTHYNGNASAKTQKGKITNPSVAAQRLYNAWKKKSKKAALKVASPAAVSKLLSVKWRPMKFKGCHNTGGSFECIYTDAGLDLDLAMVIEGGASAGYHVESVSFSSEAAFLPVLRPQLTGLLISKRNSEYLHDFRMPGQFLSEEIVSKKRIGSR